MPEITKLQENSQMLQAQGKASKSQQLQVILIFHDKHHEENCSFLSVIRMARNLIPNMENVAQEGRTIFL
jgi:hypothetical protein